MVISKKKDLVVVDFYFDGQHIHSFKSANDSITIARIDAVKEQFIPATRRASLTTHPRIMRCETSDARIIGVRFETDVDYMLWGDEYEEYYAYGHYPRKTVYYPQGPICPVSRSRRKE